MQVMDPRKKPDVAKVVESVFDKARKYVVIWWSFMLQNVRRDLALSFSVGKKQLNVSSNAVQSCEKKTRPQ